jgi:hypothetical protein
VRTRALLHLVAALGGHDLAGATPVKRVVAVIALAALAACGGGARTRGADGPTPGEVALALAHGYAAKDWVRVDAQLAPGYRARRLQQICRVAISALAVEPPGNPVRALAAKHHVDLDGPAVELAAAMTASPPLTPAELQAATERAVAACVDRHPPLGFVHDLMTAAFTPDEGLREVTVARQDIQGDHATVVIAAPGIERTLRLERAQGRWLVAAIEVTGADATLRSDGRPTE